MVIATIQGALEINENSITKHWFSEKIVSKGLLVMKHYKEVEAVLRISNFLKEGRTYESITAYYYEEKDIQDAPCLAQCLDPLENQLNLMTDGEYNAVVSSLENRGSLEYKYWGEIQNVWQEIKQLRASRFYENEIFHRPGIPRIETIGGRLVEKNMDLIWKIDNDLPNMWDDIISKIDQGDFQV